jgi:hypothetical protein
MDIRELRGAILAALDFAQVSSGAPQTGDPAEWHFRDQDRMRFFFAHLAGCVAE